MTFNFIYEDSVSYQGQVLSRKEFRIVSRWSEFDTSQMRAQRATVVTLLSEHPN